MHAHFSFLMWKNLASAMKWKFLGIKDPAALEGLMFFVSVSVPIVPTILILALNLDPNSMEKAQKDKAQVFLTKYFFCVVNEPAWWGYRIWFLLFSVPGIIATFLLFWYTAASRKETIRLSKTSQFSKSQVARIFFALITYLILSILSVFSGFSAPKDDDVIHASDYIPAAVGFLLFITYGMGKPAKEFFMKMYIKLGKKMGIDFSNIRTSVSSKSDSISVSRRQSSIKSTDTRSRRPSQLSESVDEYFIYDLPRAKTEEPVQKPVSKHLSVKRNNIRRGSEPSTRREAILKANKKLFEIILEENEEIEEESDLPSEK